MTWSLFGKYTDLSRLNMDFWTEIISLSPLLHLVGVVKSTTGLMVHVLSMVRLNCVNYTKLY